MSAVPAAARPFVFHRAILNGASFVPQASPNGAIARGSIFSIFGRELGPTEGVAAAEFPLLNELADVSVDVCQGETCEPAIPLFVRADQINAIMRSETPLGASVVRVTFGGEEGNSSPVEVAEASVGLFSVNGGGFGPGIVQNFITQANQPLNSTDVVAEPGTVVTLWGTGLGAALGPDELAPQAGNVRTTVEIFVGPSRVSRILYAGRAPCCSGLDQIVFEVPSDAPTGCYVPVHLRTNGQVVSSSVTMAIGTESVECSDEFNPLRELSGGGRTGLALASRVLTSRDLLPGISMDFATDMVAGVFQEESRGPWRFNRAYSLPPPGSCTTYAQAEGRVRPQLLADLIRNGSLLDAGETLAISGSVGQTEARPLPLAGNLYGALAGTNLETARPLLELFFGAPDSLRVTGRGGDEVGAFEVSLESPAAILWTNESSTATITRGSQVEITWTGGEPGGLVLLLALGANRLAQAASGFACVERTDAGKITVGNWVTSTLTADEPGAADGLIILASLPGSAAPFQTDGLDAGVGLFVVAASRAVDIR